MKMLVLFHRNDLCRSITESSSLVLQYNEIRDKNLSHTAVFDSCHFILTMFWRKKRDQYWGHNDRSEKKSSKNTIKNLQCIFAHFITRNHLTLLSHRTEMKILMFAYNLFLWILSFTCSSVRPLIGIGLLHWSFALAEGEIVVGLVNEVTAVENVLFLAFDLTYRSIERNVRSICSMRKNSIESIHRMGGWGRKYTFGIWWIFRRRQTDSSEFWS